MDEQKTIIRSDFTYTPAPPFVSTKRELLSSLVSYVLAYLYLYLWTAPEGWTQSLCWLLFCGGFTAWELWYGRREKHAREHWLWLGCLWVCALSVILYSSDAVAALPIRFGRIWEGWIWFFAHLYAIYWVLCHSGRLLDGKSGDPVVFDGINGAIFYPFRHFFLGLRSVLYALLHRKRSNEEKTGFKRMGYSAVAAAVGIVFFLMAASLLTRADRNFESLLGGVLALLPRWNLDGVTEFVIRLVFSLPIGAYLNGLVSGSLREKPETLEQERTALRSALERLRRIPAVVWEALLGAFVLLYLLFFVVQGQYLFGAMLGGAPAAGYTVAEYARQGFFELCKIMALNFALLWVVAVSSEKPIRQRPVMKLLSTLLMSESVLFAVTAFSKLALYIARFSFTPLRFQSAWFITVMLTGCLCVLVQLWTGRKTAGFWVYFTGLSLALTVLY